MASKFITNTRGEKLSDRIRALAQKSGALDFLVSYFFFSGFCEICQDLREKPLRILIGMDADVDAKNCIVEYTAISGSAKNADSKLAVKRNYFENLKKIINKADAHDAKKIDARQTIDNRNILY